MENEHEVVVEDIVEVKDDDGNDTTDWKALALKNQGIAKRLKTKLEKSAEKAKEVKVETPIEKIEKKEPTDLGYDQKAFLKASGISGADEMALVKDQLKVFTGTLDDLIENPYFKQRLETLRTNKANADAASGASNRSGGTARTSVEYWLAKGEHPPKELGRELAEKYVEARRGHGANKKMFYND